MKLRAAFIRVVAAVPAFGSGVLSSGPQLGVAFHF
jgi:hypothetical protein